MRRSNFLVPVLALMGLIVFLCLLTRLLLLRYERGDIYPAYSSLRADPLGTRALYEALGSLPEFTVERGFRSLAREISDKPGTLLYLGIDHESLITFTKDEIAQLNGFVRNGGRVVLTFAPETPTEADSGAGRKRLDEARSQEAKSQPLEPSHHETKQEKYEREAFRREHQANPLNPGDEAEEKYEPSLAAIWGFGTDLAAAAKIDAKTNDDSAPPPTEKPEVLATPLGAPNLDPSVPWKSALYFVRLEPDWQELYRAKSNPVLVRRKWGKGEIILASDSYFLSNEGLRADRRLALLGLLTGPAGHLLFDETHLGTDDDEGVMSITRKFGLEGYLFGTLGVLLLFLWRSSIPLVPPRALGQQVLLGGAVSGKDSRSGLANLLRRNIARSEILKTSFTEWRRNVTPDRQHLSVKMAEMEALLAGNSATRPKEIVQSYHQLRKLNTIDRGKGKYAAKS